MLGVRTRPIVLLAAGLALILFSHALPSAPAPPREATWFGLRPFAADCLRIDTLRVAGLAGAGRAASRRDPTNGAVADRLILAFRLAPDRADLAWDDCLLLSTLGDSDGLRRYLRAARENIPPGESRSAAWLEIVSLWFLSSPAR